MPDDPPVDPPTDPTPPDGPTLEELQSKYADLESKFESSTKKWASQTANARKEAEEAKSRLKEIEDAKETATREALEKDGKLDELKEFYEKKIQQTDQTYKSEIEGYRTSLVERTTGALAMQIASELAVPGKAETLLPHVRSRLATAWKDGEPTTEFLTKDGQASALTLDQFKGEIKTDPRFDTIVAGSKSSGGGTKAPEQRNAPTQQSGKSMSRDAFEALQQERGGHAKIAEFFKGGGVLEG